MKSRANTAGEGKEGKKLSFQYIIMIAAPISQTLYSMILMNSMLTKQLSSENTFLLSGVVLGRGLAILNKAG